MGVLGVWAGRGRIEMRNERDGRRWANDDGAIRAGGRKFGRGMVGGGGGTGGMPTKQLLPGIHSTYTVVVPSTSGTKYDEPADSSDLFGQGRTKGADLAGKEASGLT